MGGFEVENRELFIMAHEGQKEARDILFEKNAGLIHHVMKRYKSVIMTYKNIEAEDIYQMGSIGLLKAIDRFDTDYGVCFSTGTYGRGADAPGRRQPLRLHQSWC